MGESSPSALDMSPMICEKATMAAAVQGDFPTQELLTHRGSLEELPLAMRDTEERPEGFPKGWINYD